MTADSRDALKREIEAQIEEHEVRVVRMGAVDSDGLWRGKGVPVEYFLGSIVDEGAHISQIMYAWDVADELIPGVPFAGWHNGYPDFVLMPDLSTFCIPPWQNGEAFVICDVFNLDGSSFAQSPREVLRRVLSQAAETDYTPMIGYELEFLLLKESSKTLREKGFRDLDPLQHGSSAYNLYRLGLHSELLRDLRAGMDGLGVDLEGTTTEYGESQFEINLKYTTALRAADQAVLYKVGMKEIAAQHGATATFMAKYDDRVGNSGHIHQSLVDQSGRNVMWDEDDPDHLSEVARHYIGGLVRTMREFTIFFCPTVNSYKRKLNESFTSTAASWGIDNRTAGLRVLPSSPRAARIEHRLGGGDANPHLAIAATIAGGMYGVVNELDPGEKVVGNAYELDPTQAERLPWSLEEAANATDRSELARELLGDEFVDLFVHSRRWELECERQAVTDWERARYLELI